MQCHLICVYAYVSRRYFVLLLLHNRKRHSLSLPSSTLFATTNIRESNCRTSPALECILSRVLYIFRKCGRVDCANNIWANNQNKKETNIRNEKKKQSSHMRTSACARLVRPHDVATCWWSNRNLTHWFGLSNRMKKRQTNNYRKWFEIILGLFVCQSFELREIIQPGCSLYDAWSI